MPRFLKRGMDAGAIKAADAKVRETVEVDPRRRSRSAATTRCATLSEQFDKWSPASFKLTPQEIEQAIGQVAKRDLEDIKFAQAQVRGFAQKQRETMKDLEVETLPGVDPRPPPHPGELDRLLRAGRALSDGRLGAHVDRHREGRGREAHHRLRAALQGRTASRDRRRDAFRRRGRDLRARRRAGGRRDGARHRHDRRRRHDRRAGQRLCGGGEAPALRPHRHRPARRPDRDADHRGRLASTAKSARPTCSARPSTGRPRPRC